MKWLLSIIILSGMILGTAAVNWAQELPSGHPAQLQQQPKSLESIEFLTGFGFGEMSDKDDAYSYPVIIDLDFDMRGLAEKISLYPPGLLQFVVEPYFSFIEQPETNIETGVAFLIKIGFLPETSRFQPYFKGGPGLSYMTLHTREQGGQFNFIEYGIIGAHFILDEKWALTAEYRFRHLSNADMDNPNKGINTDFFLAGLTYRY